MDEENRDAPSGTDLIPLPIVNLPPGGKIKAWQFVTGDVAKVVIVRGDESSETYLLLYDDAHRTSYRLGKLLLIEFPRKDPNDSLAGSRLDVPEVIETKIDPVVVRLKVNEP